MVVSLVAVFVVLALNRLQLYQEAAEKAGMETIVAGMQSGLQLRVAQLLIEGDMESIKALGDSNPARLLSDMPAGYAGELSQAAPALPGRSWYFDLNRREIVYVPELTAHLTVNGAAGEGARLRFRASVRVGSASEGARLEFRGAGLERLQRYVWFKEGDLPMPEAPSGTTGFGRPAKE